MDNIPNRKEFRRVEVERITSLSGKVLDYWEVEFAAFVPKIREGVKIYQYKDVEIILKLKQYLTKDRLNKAEIKAKLLEIDPNIKKKEEEVRKEIKKNLQVSFKKQKINEKPKKENIIKQIPKDPIKKTDKTEYKLQNLKQDLLDILTILGNNDKKGY